MYCQLLADAVKHIKGEPVEAIPTANIDLGLAASIPKGYIPLDRSRLDVYRRVAVAKTADELKQLESELADVYGTPPEEVRQLLETAELRIAAGKLDISSIVAHGGNLIFSFTADAAKNAKKLFRNLAAKYTVADETMVYLHLAKSYSEPATLMSFLRKILNNRRNK
jgi:transcription-repair coupling factor (superfamily II helicase)